MSEAPRRAEALTALRVIVGLALLSRPQIITGDRRGVTGVATAVRVLGARDVLQAPVFLGRGRAGRLLGSAVDIAHACSMLTVAALRRNVRRPALISATLAAAWARAELRTPGETTCSTR